MSKEIHLIIHKDDKSPKGIRFEISDYWVSMIRKELKESGESMLKAIISFIIPESNNQRRFLHGGLIPLWIKLDGNNFKDSSLCDFYFEVFKREHYPEAVKINGKVEIRGKSSKGSKALNKITEMMIDFLVENYGLRYESEVLNPENYKKFRDELFSTGKWERYLDYCEEMGWLKFTRFN